MLAHVTVLYFAIARERAGVPREDFENVPSVRALLAAVVERHPAMKDVVPHLRVALNQEFVGEDALLPAGAEVALIPPVAGGAGLFQVVDRPLRLEEVVAAVTHSGRGGLVTFTGNVRDETRGKRVVRLEYEAYVPMAERRLAAIGDEVSARWPGTSLAIVHRVGVLLPGEAAVVMAAAAPHRKEAFRACEHAIDRLKEDVPIWKKEVYENGEVWVGMGP